MSTARAASDGNFKPKIAKASWKHLFVFTRRKHWNVLVPALCSSCFVSIVKSSLPIALGQFFQIAADFASGDASGPETLDKATDLSLVLCGLGAGYWLANTCFLSTWVVFGELQAKSARESIFESLLEKEIKWYDAQSDGISSLLVRIET